MFGIVFVMSMISFGLINIYGVPFTEIEGLNTNLRKDAIKDLSHLADVKKYELTSWLFERRADMRLSAESPVLRDRVRNLGTSVTKHAAAGAGEDVIRKELIIGTDYKPVTQYLRAMVNAYEAYDEIIIADPLTWMVLAATDADITGHKLSDHEQFPTVITSGQEEVLEIRKDPMTDNIHLYIVNVMKNSSGINASEARTFAVLIAKIDVSNFITPMLNTGEDLGRTGEINLIDQDGNHLTKLKYPLTNHDKRGHSRPVGLARPARLALDGMEGIIADTDYRNVKVIAATRHIPVTAETSWGMVLKIDEQEVFAPLRKSILLYVVITFFGAFMVLGLTYVVATRLSRPLEQLSTTVRRIEAGDLTARSRLKSSDETGALSSAFDSMAEKIQRWNEELENRVKDRTEALRKSEERLRLYYDLPFIGMAITSPKDKRWLQVNDRLCEIFGYPRERLVEMTWTELTYPEDLAPDVAQFDRVIRGETNGYKMDKRFIRSDGQIIYATIDVKCIRHEDGTVDYFVATVQDITERKKLEAQLMQAQKMESIGILAGGVAHDFNNALTAIIGFAYILKSRLKDDALVSRHVEHIISVCNRAAGTVSSLLAFSRKQMIAPRPVDLNNIVRDVEMLLKNLIGEDIDLLIRACNGPLIIVADPAQLDQIIINLATNARDAMPHGGRLTIETDRFYIDEESAKVQLFSRPGPYARLIVSDTGVGIDEKIMDMIFEPFYTTKDIGKGTGLGLAMVYGLIKQHDGNIIVNSETGKGTTFVIYLPLKEDAALETAVPETEELPEGTETVLVAEDNKDVRITFKSILEESGYTVITAVDGEDAVSKFRENKDTVRLCILDVIMPKRSGKDVYDELRNISPDIKALFISGYTGDILDRQEILDRDLDFISKPFSPGTLLKKVQEVLAKGSDS